MCSKDLKKVSREIGDRSTRGRQLFIIKRMFSYSLELTVKRNMNASDWIKQKQRLLYIIHFYFIIIRIFHKLSATNYFLLLNCNRLHFLLRLFYCSAPNCIPVFVLLLQVGCDIQQFAACIGLLLEGARPTFISRRSQSNSQDSIKLEIKRLAPFTQYFLFDFYTPFRIKITQ